MYWLLEIRPALVPPGTSPTRRAATDGSLDTESQSTKKASNSTTKSSNSTKVKQDPDILLRPTIDGPAGVGFETQTQKVKQEIPEPIYPEEQEEGTRPAPRVDIEQINLVTDDEDDVVDSGRDKGKGRMISTKGGLRPVRLQREEHKERVAMVNTEPAASTLANDTKEPGGLSDVFALPDNEDTDRVESSREDKNWSGAWQDDEVEAKYDPTAVVDGMDVDIIADAGTRHKTHKVPLGQPGDEHEPTISRSNEKDKSKPLRKSGNKEKQPILQTEEDRAEYMRHLEDVEILARELGGLQCPPAVANDAGAIDLDVEMTDEQPRVKDKEGRLYLFQFPPVLPPLRNKTKTEEATIGHVDAMEVETAPHAAAETIDLTKPDPEEVVEIKTEPGLSTAFHAAPELVQEEGFIGKLVVRKSGKVELDWGGTILNLGRGAESNYLTTTMITEELGENEGSSSANAIGTGTGLGRVMGKFVATPDLEKLLEGIE
jgi:DNA-directed RNA polymerase III subunit RPC4